MRKIIFFRGLVTYNDDNFHLGPVSIGDDDQNISQSLKKFNYEGITVLNMGLGSVEQMAMKAYKELSKHKIWVDKNN